MELSIIYDTQGPHKRGIYSVEKVVTYRSRRRRKYMHCTASRYHMRRRILDQAGEEECMEETHPLMRHHNSIISCSSCLRFRQYSILGIYIYIYMNTIYIHYLILVVGVGGGAMRHTNNRIRDTALHQNIVCMYTHQQLSSTHLNPSQPMSIVNPS